MATATLPTAETATDTFPINGTDYIEFWVGNARQAALYYRAAFGFELVGYRGPETGVRDRASYLLQQDKVRFVLTKIEVQFAQTYPWRARRRLIGRRSRWWG